MVKAASIYTTREKKSIAKMFTIIILTIAYTRFIAYIATLLWSYFGFLSVVNSVVDLVTRLFAPAAAIARQDPDPQPHQAVPAPPVRRPRRQNYQLKATRKTKVVHSVTTFEEIVVHPAPQ